MEKLNSYYGMITNDYLFAKSGLTACESLGNYNAIVSLCTQAGEKFFENYN